MAVETRPTGGKTVKGLGLSERMRPRLLMLDSL